MDPVVKACAPYCQPQGALHLPRRCVAVCRSAQFEKCNRLVSSRVLKFYSRPTHIARSRLARLRFHRGVSCSLFFKFCIGQTVWKKSLWLQSGKFLCVGPQIHLPPCENFVPTTKRRRQKLRVVLLSLRLLREHVWTRVPQLKWMFWGL